MAKMITNTILGSKLKMGQEFVEGARVPVTLISAGPCVVTQIKNMEKDGYWAVQFGFGHRKIKNTSKALQGHLKISKETKEKTTTRYLKEVRMSEEPSCKVGDVVAISDVLSVGDTVSVTGTSKGKGFAGGIKRWGFAGGPKTHGQSDRHRAPGSIGQGTTPGRVYKGKHMAGRMGSDTKTIKNLKVISVNADKNIVAISGQVPGRSGGLVFIKRLSERKEVEANDQN